MDELAEISWRGTVIGELSEAVPDMWYLSGTWKGNSSAEAGRFEALARSFDPKAVWGDPVLGTRVELTYHASKEPTHALVLSLTDDQLSVRRVFERDAVAWLVANVT